MFCLLRRWKAPLGQHRSTLTLPSRADGSKQYPPTGNRVTVTGMDMVRVAEGKIVEWWHIEDMLGMLQQLGIVPPPGQGAGQATG